MTPPRISIKLCYDIVSPYSYLAFETLTRYRELWNIDIELCPYFLGGIMVAANNRPPMSVKLKGEYLTQEVKRLGEEAGLRINLVWVDGPPNTMGVARFLRAYKDVSSPTELENVSRRLFVELFKNQGKPTNPGFLGCLTPDLIPEAKFKEVLARSGSQEIKDLVKAESAALVKDYGAFGFPWIIVRRADGTTNSFFGMRHGYSLIPVAKLLDQEATGSRTWLGGLGMSTNGKVHVQMFPRANCNKPNTDIHICYNGINLYIKGKKRAAHNSRHGRHDP